MDPTSWMITIVGSISAALTTVAFVPQVVRVWRLQDATDISLPTFAIFSVGLVGWVVYGTQVASIPIVAANCVTLLLALVIVGLKLRFDRSARSTPSDLS
jgi:MtN3 and saliva related transmembrane protein